MGDNRDLTVFGHRTGDHGEAMLSWPSPGRNSDVALLRAAQWTPVNSGRPLSPPRARHTPTTSRLSAPATSPRLTTPARSRCARCTTLTVAWTSAAASSACCRPLRQRQVHAAEGSWAGWTCRAKARCSSCAAPGCLRGGRAPYRREHVGFAFQLYRPTRPIPFRRSARAAMLLPACVSG